MMHNLIWLAGIGITALLIAAVASRWFKKVNWDGDGFAVWLLIALVLFLISCGFGVFGIEGN